MSDERIVMKPHGGMRANRMAPLLSACLVLVAVLAGCQSPRATPSAPGTSTLDTETLGSPTATDTSLPRDTGGDPWSTLTNAVDDADLTDFTLMIGTTDGPVFVRSKGDSTPDDTLLIASASKWLAVITILTLVEDGTLSLDDHPSNYLPWWTTDPTDPRSSVTLEQLLSFTSGLGGAEDEVPCVEDGDLTIDACAQILYDEYFVAEPGTTFIYGPAHLQVAGAMVTAATGDTFQQVFRRQVATPLRLGLLTAFAVPSLENPRIAGGATASVTDYGAILTALAAGELLSDAMVQRMALDHTGAAVVMSQVPEIADAGSNDWHYALGCWRECALDPYPAACDEPGVLSSAGAFGFYPWWDTARGFWGIVGILLAEPDGGATTTIPAGQAWSELAAEALAQ